MCQKGERFGVDTMPEIAGDCDHGIAFDEAEARRILGDWWPAAMADYVAGNPRAAEVRR